MQRQPLIGVSVVISLAVGVMLGLALWRTRSALEREGQAWLSVANLDVGEVWAQKGLRWPIQVTNRTGGELEVLEVRTTCKCAQVEPPSLVISRGQTAPMTLTLDLRQPPGGELTAKPRPFAVHIAFLIRSEQGTARRQYVLSGRAKDLFLFSESPASLGKIDSLPIEARLRPKVVRFESAVPLASVVASCNPPLVTALPLLDAENRGLVQLTAAADLQPGRFECEVELLATARDGQRLPGAILPVNGEIVHDVEVAPAVISFRPAVVGEEVDGTVFLSSRTGAPFAARPIVPPGVSISVEPGDSASGEGLQYRIRKRIGQPGSRSDVVEFAVGAEGLTEQRLRLRVNSIGLHKGEE